MTPPRFLVKVDARGILEIENIGRGVILGGKVMNSIRFFLSLRDQRDTNGVFV